MAKKKKRIESTDRQSPPRSLIAFKIDDGLRSKLTREAARQDRNVSQMIIHYIKIGLGLSTPVGSNDNT